MFSEDIQIITGFYSITLKEGVECELKYGRQYYDFQEGSLMFLAPEQTISVTGSHGDKELNGWSLFFHPDLLRKSHLGKKMKEYTFFSYEANEAFIYPTRRSKKLRLLSKLLSISIVRIWMCTAAKLLFLPPCQVNYFS